MLFNYTTSEGTVRNLFRTSTHRSTSYLDRTSLIQSPIAHSLSAHSQPAQSQPTHSQPAHSQPVTTQLNTNLFSDETPAKKKRGITPSQIKEISELPRCLKIKKKYETSDRVLRKRY
jgi:hypothetical protein